MTAQGDPRESDERSIVPPPHIPGRRVLVVEDNRDCAEMVAAFLEALGHEVHVAFDGPRGLDLARQVKPDIACVDIGLPGMDGFELTRCMRQMPACAMIPIIAVSGYAGEIDRDAARRAGFSEHFAKPIDLACLEDVVERAGRTA